MKRFLPPLIFLIISLTLIIIWFRQGLLYGGAEVGLLTYNPARWFEIQRFLWWEAVAPGWPIPHFLNATPFYFLLSLLKLLGFSPLALQGFVFFVLLFLMGFGVYLFTLSVLGKEKKNYALLAGLFYMFNPYTMVDVWHRFVYTGFFLAAFLPFLGLFWKNWIYKGSILSLTLFLLTNFLASYMFGNLSSMITVWVFLTILTLSRIFFPWQGILDFLQIGKRFLLGFTLWILINTWWLLPIFATGTGLLSESNSAEVNLTTLVNISRKTILPYSLQLTNPFYLFFTAELGEAYKNFPITAIPWIGTIIILIGIIFALRNISTSQYAISYLIGVFLAKGVATPFSAPLLFAFTNFYFLGVLRNPYEKLGILLPFFGSILFVIGLEKIISSSNKTVRVIILIIILIFFGYSLPMLTGKIFGNKQYPLEVKVPDYYKQADEWLGQFKEEEGNILHLPFSGRDVVTYEWNKGYHGVEINELLFTSHPSISRKVGLKNADKLLESLTYQFSPPYPSDKDQILKVLQNLSVRFIVLHKDTNWLDISTYGINIKQNNPYELETVLRDLPFLEKVASFDKLDIYKINEQNFKSKIFISNDVQLIFPGAVSIVSILSHSQNKGEVITPINGSITEIGFRQILVFPQKQTSYRRLQRDVLKNIARGNSILNKLDIMRNYFDQSGELESKRKTEQIIEASKILLLNNNSSLNRYGDLINTVFENDFKSLSLVKLFGSDLNAVFQTHLFILNQSVFRQGKEKELAMKVIEDFKTKLIANDFLPEYQFNSDQDEGLNKQLFKFHIPSNSIYELMLNNAETSELYPDLVSNIDLQINGEGANFGEISLDRVEYEMSFNELLSSNLVEPINEWIKGGNVSEIENKVVLTSLGEESFIESPVSGIGGGDKLRVSFEGFLENGNIFYVLISSDTEYQENGNQRLSFFHQCIVHICYPLQQSSNTSGWQNFDLTTQNLNPSTRKASLKILLPLGGKLHIRNIQVQKVLDNTLFLRKEFPDLEIANLEGKIENINRHSPVLYNGKISLKKPSFIFFNQTFHPGWSLRLKNNGIDFFVNEHYIGNYFANAWYIGRAGEYDFEIEFKPQKNVNIGYIVSSLTGTGIFVAFLFMKLRKKYV